MIRIDIPVPGSFEASINGQVVPRVEAVIGEPLVAARTFGRASKILANLGAADESLDPPQAIPPALL